MNFDHLYITDVDGERRIAADRLPLRIGTSSDCDLQVPGPGAGAVVLLDLLDGVPFVQPAARDAALLRNGEALLSSQRLQDGDELQYYGSRIQVRADDKLILRVLLEDSAYITRPPELPDVDKVAAEEAIAPTAFQRARETQAAQPVRESHTVRNVLIIGLALLGFASWLLFTSKSVRFAVDPPEPDSFSIAGGWFRLPLGDRVLLREGDYTLTVSKQGYYDVEQAFVIDEQQSRTVSVEMRKLPGKLTVRTQPAGDATVAIDDLHVGPAPLGPIELQPGEHSINITSDRFLPFSDIISFPGLGEEQVLNVQLTPRWADVTVTSQPAGATIYAGDEKVGETPAVIELLEGGHQLSVVLDGYKAWDGSVTTEPNVPLELPLIQLQEANASLQVNTVPNGANVMVNGRYRGQSPLTLDLAPDTDYEIGLSKAGYGLTTRKVRLRSAVRDTINVDLSAKTGAITVNVSPADASIFVDGNLRGTGNTTLQLSSAPHRIEVRKEGYQSWSKSITPRPGFPQTLSAALRSDEEVARSKIAQVVTAANGKQLRRVEPQTFVMGSSRSEQGRRANEVLVPVTVSKPFYISTHEVTNKEFAEFAAGHDSGSAVHVTLGADTNPVANVTWEQAAEYCNYLSAQEGLTPVYEERFGSYEPIYPLPDGYRLPTEAEWVLAMRYAGGTEADKFSWGDFWPPERDAGNYADRSGAELLSTTLPNYDDGFAATAPVGRFPANRLGLYDGGGNVAEWVNDFYTVPTPGLTAALQDPTGPSRGESHVIRGSSWKHAGVTELRLSYRDYGKDARTDVGFRIARNAEVAQ